VWTFDTSGRFISIQDRFGNVDLTRMRWSVVVRDGGRCDLLGDGVPALRMAAAPPPTSAPTGSGVPSETPASPGSRVAIVAVAVIAVAALALLSLMAIRRRR
jgi:hypothetical protein